MELSQLRIGDAMTSALEGGAGRKLARTSLRDQAVDALRDMVINGVIPAGSRVNEAELAEMLGISRGPLREAIQRLSAEGLIEFRRNRGAFVRELALEDIRLLYEVREVLESAAAKRAAREANDDQIADLERQIAQVDSIVSTTKRGRAHDPHAEVLELSNDFHVTVLDICKNPYLQRYGADLQAQLRVARLHSEPSQEHAEQVVAEHRAIVEAITKRDGAAASRAMSKHLKNSLIRFEQELASATDIPVPQARSPRS
jgi:DNA-binding GntR family transcriptional regulator